MPVRRRRRRRGRVDDLIEQADAAPIPASNAPDRAGRRATTSARRWRRRCTRSTRGTSSATRSSQLEAGDGPGSATIADGFFGRNEDGSYSPGSDRYFLLSADEQNYPRRIEPFLKAGKSSYQDYDYAFWNHGYSELNWGLYPIRARDKFDGPFRTTRRDPTTLVVGTRYDPATPYKEAKRLVQQLGNARLLTMTGDGHTAYDGPGRRVQLAVRRQGDRGVPVRRSRCPAEGTKCAQDVAGLHAPAAPADVRASRRRRTW